jgi:hypothetical protein
MLDSANQAQLHPALHSRGAAVHLAPQVHQRCHVEAGAAGEQPWERVAAAAGSAGFATVEVQSAACACTLYAC